MAHSVKDRLVARWIRTQQRWYETDPKVSKIAQFFRATKSQNQNVKITFVLIFVMKARPYLSSTCPRNSKRKQTIINKSAKIAKICEIKKLRFIERKRDCVVISRKFGPSDARKSEFNLTQISLKIRNEIIDQISVMSER